MPKVLRFGIHSLDHLLGVSSKQPDARTAPFGIYLSGQDEKPAKDEVDDDKDAFTTSVCIVGPNGTGKSIFGLHMASRYLADCRAAKAKEESPVVLYISTDFTFNMAAEVWRKFALDLPFLRSDPFDPVCCRPDAKPEPLISFQRCNPTMLAGDFDPVEKRDSVVFVDIATYTAGDDWGFLHKLLSLLPMPAAKAPRHLVVIDAIEGFEALAGDLNAFGEQSTRRSRVAQVMRLIAGKCHVVLVVEESNSDERLAEEFVVDTVIRLSNVSTRNYERRVLKIEKVRGQSHIRGWHHYSIRSGDGSTTGGQINPDDPVVILPANPNNQPKQEEKAERQSYIQVFHSVHRLNRKIMEEKSKARESLPDYLYAAFGIKYLDNMLGGQHESTEPVSYENEPALPPLYYDKRGLPCSSTTALIGDSLTQKSALGKAFLSSCFSSFPGRLKQLCDWMKNDRDETANEQIWRYVYTRVSLLTDSENPGVEDWKGYIKKGDWPTLWSRLSEHLKTRLHHMDADQLPPPWKDSRTGKALTCAAAWLLDYQSGQAIMLSTHNTDHEKLACEFIHRLHSRDKLTELNKEMPGYQTALEEYIRRGTVCRRLEIHNLSSEILIHIVQQVIRHAQRKILTSAQMQDDELRYRRSWPIRLVIDDFSTFRDVIPELREDPLLLPTLLFHFEREGITTLIVDTQSGKPDTPIAERFESELRKLVQHNLYTWRVPFYGESRVAITAIPPFSYEYAGIVRELRWETSFPPPRSPLSPNGPKLLPALKEPTTVDPHLEMYTGLEEGKPQSIPLRAHLYAETPAMESYVATENLFLNEMFVPCASGVSADAASVLIGVPAPNYNEFRDFVYLQRDTRLDHTLIFQVDEFWTMPAPSRRKRAGAFQSQLPYLNAITAEKKDRPDSDVDPYKLFQPRQSEAHEFPLRRRHFYKKYYNDFVDARDWPSQDEDGSQRLIDRVPFIWDFGFLLCRAKAWESDRTFKFDKKEYTVRQVWDSLKKIGTAKEGGDKITDRPGKNNSADDKIKHVSWRIFIEACKKAAEGLSERLSKPVTAFDFAQISPESFSCLILEMWFSEIYDKLRGNGKGDESDELKRIRETLSKRRLFLPTQNDDAERPPLLLSELLEKYWLELYKSWLILIEVLNFSDIVGEATALNFDFKLRNTDFSAIASRHWYKTASQCPDDIVASEPLVAVRLPGHFSVRGDWSLALSGSSRSIRQGERALDLLSSRRANICRLQLGIGLPTRFSKDKSSESLRTRLISHQRGQDNIDYGTLLKIGAGTEGGQADDFFWLWRSSLDDYSHCNRIWHKWLNRVLLSWYRNLLRYKSVWINSFSIYDKLTETSPQDLKKFAPTSEELEADLKSFRIKFPKSYDKKLETYLGKFDGKPETVAQLRVRGDFKRLLEVLIEELKQAAEEDRHA